MKGVGAVPQFFALVLPKIFDLAVCVDIPVHSIFLAEPKKTQVLHAGCILKS